MLKILDFFRLIVTDLAQDGRETGANWGRVAVLIAALLVVIWIGGFFAVAVVVAVPVVGCVWVWIEKKFAFKYGRGGDGG